MKYLVITATLLASTAAQAADTGTPTYNWSGAYIGLQAGGRWAEESAEGMGMGGMIYTDIKPNGFLIGGYAGYNYQFGAVVVGVEGNVVANTVSSRRGDYDIHFKDSTKAVASLNARLGYAIDRTLIYGTAGYSKAYYATELSYNWTETYKQNRNGYNIGAGVEYAITDNIIARAEYRYFDFGKVAHESGEGQTKYKQQTAILGLAYKF